MKKIFKFNEYVLNYYYKLGKNFSDLEIESVKDQLEQVNKSSGCNFSYGIFDQNKKFKDCTENFMICVIEKDSVPVGFFYNYIIESHKIVHLGLVVISKNFGENLLYIPYMISNQLIYDQIGEFYITNISSVPKIIGEVSVAFDDVWPSPKANLIRPTTAHKEVAQLIYENYVKVFFPMPESTFLDSKRFVLCCNAKEMGFERDFRKLARHQELEVNMFCMFWINYEKNEDIIQVGKYSEQTSKRNHPIIKKIYEPSNS